MGTATAPSCTARNEGYNASGTLTSATLTPGTKKDHFDGTITVDVTRANHKTVTGMQTFTLTDARARFGKGVSSTAPAAGSRVRVHGKVTVLPHGCSTTGFTPTVTIGNFEIKQAK
jgi:ribosomal protein L31